MNAKQQILDAAIRVMSEVGITPTTEEMTMSGDFKTNTPISAEEWEAMHGIGQEPIQDERTIMMIRRAIINDTAGHFGRTSFDSVRVWRLYSTPSGEIWGAQWTHFRMANGNVIDWQESTWGTMQHVRSFIDATAELQDTLAEWERY